MSFKLGGNGTGGNSKGTHVVRHCVAFDNNFRSKKGFDQNSHKGGVLVQNCTAWGNGYNFMFEDAPDSGTSNEFANNVEFAHVGGPEEHLVGRLPVERRMRHLGVVLVDVEFHQRPNTRRRIQGVQAQPLMTWGCAITRNGTIRGSTTS